MQGRIVGNKVDHRILALAVHFVVPVSTKRQTDRQIAVPYRRRAKKGIRCLEWESKLIRSSDPPSVGVAPLCMFPAGDLVVDPFVGESACLLYVPAGSWPEVAELLAPSSVLITSATS